MTTDTDTDTAHAAFRARFPGLESMTYLAACSQGAYSDALAAAMTRFQSVMLQYGNPWRVWEAQVDRARAAFARFIGADEDEVAIVPSASEGAYQIASGFDWGERSGIVTTELEFPSLAYVWLAQRERGAEVRFAETSGSFATLEGYRAAITRETALVSVPLNTYAHGQRLPVEDVVAHAATVGARVFVDAFQGLGVEPVDVHELGCDYLVAGALKYLLGIPGMAFLYVRRGAQPPRDPQLTGWFGQRDPLGFDPRTLDPAVGARRYEVGTPSVAAAYGAAAGIELLETVDARARHERVRALTAQADAGLRALGLTLASPSAALERGPQVAFLDADPAGLARALAERGVVVSPRGEIVRVAFHGYSDEGDVERLLRAVREVR